MADAYPWGAQAPSARLTKLEGTLQKSVTAKNKYLEGHRQKIAEFDEAERQLKADIRACEAIVENERRSEENTSELQSNAPLVCRLLLEQKTKTNNHAHHLYN